MSEIERVAKGLTEAQRAAIFRADSEWRFLGLASRPDVLHPIFERWNKPYGGFQYRLTPLGLQVRDYLKAHP